MSHKCPACDCRRDPMTQEFCPICMARFTGRQPAGKMIGSERIREIKFYLNFMMENNIPLNQKYLRIHELSGISQDQIGNLDPDTILSRARQWSPHGDGWSGRVIYSGLGRSRSRGTPATISGGISNVPAPRPYGAPGPQGSGFVGQAPSAPQKGFSAPSGPANPTPTPTPSRSNSPKRGWANSPLTIISPFGEDNDF